MSTTEETTPQKETLNTKEMRRILTSSLLGTTIEYYDFVLYSTAAAIVFSKVFFAGMDPASATLASFATLAAGYLARPLGGAIFGHFGDRIGRKKMLVLSMLIMGLATMAIGLIPPSSVIGVAAPIILVTLRVVQGIAVGGEWGGATLIALEHAPSGKRGFAAGFTNMGAPAGAALATISLSLMTLLPEDDFLAWGWRLPFVVSLGLVIIGLVVRLKVAESPLFQSFETQAEKRRVPIMEIFVKHKKVLILGTLVAIGQFSISGLMTVWAVDFAVGHGADKTGVLNAKALSAVILFICTVSSAILCDKLGRKKVLGAGIVLGMLAVFPVLQLVSTGTVAGYAAGLIIAQIVQGILFGPLGAFLSELFPTGVRYTGASLTFQSASTIGAGFTPVIAATLVTLAGGGITFLGWAWVATFAVCLSALLLAKEGKGRKLSSID